ncbi:hypothetical protein GWK91_02585 [Virgibacillus sp. MSP4-1]|uniref:hypothetical protein n=1 Tax=Virgibacillus sp. MSP4-1 TaxID=2700081 RepID=UPI00137BB629|nr:hypothetical protein [Virgibacillus sp. MSP4-1]QHS21894.1 hypothetical protein GWK91_02585 [Virgibacillus sp. MSP4-1]
MNEFPISYIRTIFERSDLLAFFAYLMAVIFEYKIEKLALLRKSVSQSYLCDHI